MGERRKAWVDPRTGLKYPVEVEPEYHDCPRAKQGKCDPMNPQPDCPDCHGRGYIEAGG